MIEAKFLHISPNGLKVGIDHDDEGEPILRILFEYDAREAPWLAPDLQLALSLTPQNARILARTLIHRADEAEN